MRTLKAAFLLAPVLIQVPGAVAQTWSVEADPDFYFDRGLTMAVGAKPSAKSRWTFLGDFASRKIGPLRDDFRMTLRLGGVVRYRLIGQRSGLFAQVNGSADEVRLNCERSWHGSVRPGLGVQLFSWETRQFYFAPLVAAEDPPGPRPKRLRAEWRVGWQFGAGD